MTKQQQQHSLHHDICTYHHVHLLEEIVIDEENKKAI